MEHSTVNVDENTATVKVTEDYDELATLAAIRNAGNYEASVL